MGGVDEGGLSEAHDDLGWCDFRAMRELRT